MDCYLHEGIKVLYRVAMAIMQLFYKHSAPQNSDWMKEIQDHGIDAALIKFCRQIPVTPHIPIKLGLPALSDVRCSIGPPLLFSKTKGMA